MANIGAKQDKPMDHKTCLEPMQGHAIFTNNSNQAFYHCPTGSPHTLDDNKHLVLIKFQLNYNILPYNDFKKPLLIVTVMYSVLGYWSK